MSTDRNRPQIIAHRGYSGIAPENTLAAFRAAAEAGADGVELDVQLSRDGVPVVIHDERLERTTDGSGWVGEHTASELAALDAGRWFGDGFGGEGVPTLSSVLALLDATPLIVHLELKTNRLPYPGLVPAVLDAVAEAGLEARVHLSSFNHHTLRTVQQADPARPCAALLYDRLLEPWDYVARHGFQALHPHHAAVDAALVAGCHGRGLPVRPYTVDDPADAERLLRMGVDALITNQPQRLLGLRKRLLGA